MNIIKNLIFILKKKKKFIIFLYIYKKSKKEKKMFEILISILCFFLPFKYLINILFVNYKNPFYSLQSKYEILDLKCGKTEILKIEKKNTELTPSNQNSNKNVRK